MVLFFHCQIHAAEFSFSKVGLSTYQIRLEGTLSDGDHNRLLSIIERYPVAFLGATSLVLSSPGGSVFEAIQIGRIVEKASLMTVVNENDICASACFLIFVAGQMRIANGSLLIHRPHVPAEVYDTNQVDEAMRNQRALTQLVRQYLEERSVRSKLIDKMFSRSSTKAYPLRKHELLNLGAISASFEEVAIAKCNASPEDLLEAERRSAEMMDCITALREVSKAGFLVKLIGKDKGLAAVREYARLKTVLETSGAALQNR